MPLKHEAQASPGRGVTGLFRPHSHDNPQWRITRYCGRVAQSNRFQAISIGVILINAVVIGTETYPAAVAEASQLLLFLDEACLTFFILEVLIRLCAFGTRPWHFFRSGWNIFDFLVVAAGILPFLRENVTLLRLIRLARIVRVIRVFPSLRILLTAVGRSIPGAIGLVGVGVVVLYLYGMLGWILFGQEQPDKFGTVGDAALTLFFLLTLDSVGMTVRDGMEITVLAIPYYLSFILFGGFVLMNLLIGVVITSMEEARNIEQTEAGTTDEPEVSNQELLERLDRLQHTVDRLTSRHEPAAHAPEEHSRN